MLILGELVCERCRLRFSRQAGPCPGCNQPRVLAFFDDRGRPACARCTGNRPVFACKTCGREDSQFGSRCAVCVLNERATELLADATGRSHPRLRPVYDAFMAARRPQTVLYWFNRRSPGPEILKAMARGEMEISHRAFDQLPSTRAVSYVRDLLVTTGVLPSYHGPIERMTPWLAGILSDLPHPDDELVSRFARWQVLRRLRQHGESGTLSQGAISRARATIVVTVRFLAWLRQNDLHLASLGQADMDRYTAEQPSRAEFLAMFLDWARRSSLTQALEVPVRQPPLPVVTLSDAQRWAQVETLLHDGTIALNARVAGLFTLLFAQPLARICQMSAGQVGQHPDGRVTVSFDTVPVELPGPLDRLVLDQLATPGQASYPPGDQRWLFPGAMPGRHLSTGVVRSKLVARGIHPAQSRKAAMFQLAANIPTPVLAELLGLGANTAVRWATLAARDWSQYAATRLPTHTDEPVAPAADELA